MNRAWVVLTLCGCFLAESSVGAADPVVANEAAVRKLIDQLGSKSYRERQQAVAELTKLPAPVIAGSLLQATKSSDAEVRRLARELLSAVVTRQETEQVLRPSRIRLTYRGVAIPEALADFSRRTGMQVTLPDAERTKLAGKTIDLDSGEVPFWEAYRQLCKSAGVEEVAPDPIVAQPSPYADMERRGRKVIWMDGRHMPTQQKAEGFLVRAGKANEPTFTSGALRLRALGSTSSRSPGAKEASLRFDVALEPRFIWDRIVSLQLDRVVDDQGQSLEQSGAELGDAPLMIGAGEEVLVVWDGETEIMTAPRPRTMSLAVRLGARPARTLKEIRGTLAVQAESPLEALLRVPDLLRSEKKTFEGLGGSYVKVLEASKDTTGQFTVRVEVRMPSKEADLPIGPGRMVWLNRARGLRADNGAMTPEQFEKRGLVLRDAKDQPLGLVSAKCDTAPSPVGPFNYTLVYEWKKEQPEPTSLILTGRRTVLMEVPFELKDVPLP